jgi:Fe-S-cluster-containing dehydrogenase component
MSKDNEEKQNFMERPTTRREFLKKSVEGAAGAAVSFSVLSLFTDSAQAQGIKLADGIVITDPVKCTGCRRCETNCTAVNDDKAHPYISRIKVARNYNFGKNGPSINYQNGDGQLGDFTIVAETCRQCESPRCVNVCPMDAISADPKTGARIIDQDECVGCGRCVVACPYDVPTVDPEAEKSTKCTLCEGEPACAAGCPTGAIEFIPWKEVEMALVKRERLIENN